MKRPKKILIIIPSMRSGGAEKVLIQLLNRLTSDKFEIELCVVMKFGRYLESIPKHIHVTYLLSFALTGRILTFIYTRFRLNLYQYIVKRKIRGHYDVVISFIDSSYTDLLYMLPSKPEKTIAWVHANKAKDPNYTKFLNERFVRRLIQERYGKLDTLVFVSHDAMSDFISVFGEFDDMRVIYSVFDIQGIHEASQNDQLRQDTSISQIIALGGLLPVKGYDKLIDACLILKNLGLQFKLRIFGEGPLELQLQKQIDTNELSEMVFLEGFVTNPYEKMKRADIFTMTSISEALPTSLCEAMILGLPVVVTNCSGCRELTDHGKYGIMTEMTAEAIAAGLRQLIENAELRRKYSGLSSERARIFDDQGVLDQVVALFSE